MAEAGTLDDAFIDELRDTYDAEKQLTKALVRGKHCDGIAGSSKKVS